MRDIAPATGARTKSNYVVSLFKTTLAVVESYVKLRFLCLLLSFLAVPVVAQTAAPTVPPFATPTAAPTATSIAPAATPTIAPTPAGAPYTYTTTGDNAREYKMQQLVPFFNAAGGQNFPSNQAYLNFRTESAIDQDFQAFIFLPLLNSVQGKVSALSYQQLLQICPLIGGVVTPNVNGITKCI
jgi:hypothetical protein